MNELIEDNTVEPSLNQCTTLKNNDETIKISGIDLVNSLSPLMKKHLKINSSPIAIAANINMVVNKSPPVKEN